MHLERHSSSHNTTSLGILKKRPDDQRCCWFNPAMQPTEDMLLQNYYWVKSGLPACNLRCNKKLDLLAHRPDLASQITVVRGQSNIAVTPFAHFPVEIIGEISPYYSFKAAFWLQHFFCSTSTKHPTEQYLWGNNILSLQEHCRFSPSLSHFVSPPHTHNYRDHRHQIVSFTCPHEGTEKVSLYSEVM